MNLVKSDLEGFLNSFQKFSHKRIRGVYVWWLWADEHDEQGLVLILMRLKPTSMSRRKSC